MIQCTHYYKNVTVIIAINSRTLYLILVYYVYYPRETYDIITWPTTATIVEVGVNSSVKRRSACSADRTLYTIFPPSSALKSGEEVHRKRYACACVFVCVCVCVCMCECINLIPNDDYQRNIRHATRPDAGHRHIINAYNIILYYYFTCVKTIVIILRTYIILYTKQ